ncbi:hypothetical protein G6F37_007325 [Rhizopus arrhizus]|nr:hypothetical protein G6F38_007374 [Rhizopus arrhizus]KAG1156745.1 hypothetical protein G6F37_007325 [Rhizopus arrhizus]
MSELPTSAEEALFKNFITVHAETCPHSQKKFNNAADSSPLFVKAQLNKRAIKERTKTLDRAIRAASRRVKRSLLERSEAKSIENLTNTASELQAIAFLNEVYVNAVDTPNESA